MDANLPPIPPTQRIAPVSPTVPSQTEERPKTVESAPPAPPPADDTPLLAPELRIEVDEEAQRFVQRLTDPDTGELMRQWPHESQLAFSRAAAAYARARQDWR
jgi:hypothetical protein